MLNHKLKLKLARRLRTPQEIRDRISPFDTPAWHSHCKAQQPKKKRKKKKIIEEKNYKCPGCGSKLPYSLKEQIQGNNCNCGFPPRGYKVKKKVSWFKKIFNAKINRKNNRDRSE